MAHKNAMLPWGVYIVHFAVDDILIKHDEAIISKLVRAYQFIWVEDWANENCPDNYVLSSIEKQIANSSLFEDETPDAVITTIR